MSLIGARRDLPLQRFRYGDITLVGPRHPTADDFDRTRPTPYGLAPIHQAWYCLAKGASGRTYNVQRFGYTQMTPRLNLTIAEDGKARDCEDAARTFHGYLTNRVVDGHWLVESRGRKDAAVHIDIVPGGEGHWHEANLLDLDLHDVGFAMEMYHPDGHRDAYYLAVTVTYTGEILGDPVEGIGGYEQAWANGVAEWTELSLPQQEEHWVIYVTEYADGQREVGSLYANRAGGGSGLLLTSDGPESLYGIRSELTHQDGLPSTIRWYHGGRAWECATEPVSVTSPRIPGFTFQLGQTRRVGDTRPIVRGWTFAETLPLAFS